MLGGPPAPCSKYTQYIGAVRDTFHYETKICMATWMDLDLVNGLEYSAGLHGCSAGCLERHAILNRFSRYRSSHFVFQQVTCKQDVCHMFPTLKSCNNSIVCEFRLLY